MPARNIIATSLLTLAAAGTLALAPSRASTARTETASNHADAKPTLAIESLAFLEGRWVGKLGPNSIEEDWMPLRHGNMTAAFRMFDPEGNLALLELMTISQAGPDEPVMLHLRHFDAGLVPWASEADGPYEAQLVSRAPKEVAFRATDQADSVQQIIYDGTQDGKLIVMLSFNARTERPPLRTVLTRADD